MKRNMFPDGIVRPSSILIFAALFAAAEAAIQDYTHYQQQIPSEGSSKSLFGDGTRDLSLKSHQRSKPITDCMFVASEPGPFTYISRTDEEEVCGVYLLTDPDRKIEIHFISFDVPCEQRGLVSVVDGWELNGEIFPSEIDHRLSMKQRNNEFCGKHVARTFLSSQNAALIQYRIPVRGKGFTVFVRYPKNLMPCNVLAVSTSEPFTLRNYGRRINCTYVALYPSTVRVIAMGVGVTNLLGAVRTTETGTLRRCDKTNSHDQVQIGGSYGLDTSKVQLVDSICGIDSKPDYRETVEYGVTSVRLISSGFFDNFVTVNVEPFGGDILDTNFDL